MSNVIPFPSRTADTLSSFLSAPEAFLAECRETLDENDYEDLIEAIEDVDFYEDADYEIQVLVEEYANILLDAN